jgi:hypothetical protein
MGIMLLGSGATCSLSAPLLRRPALLALGTALGRLAAHWPACLVPPGAVLKEHLDGEGVGGDGPAPAARLQLHVCRGNGQQLCYMVSLLES